MEENENGHKAEEEVREIEPKFAPDSNLPDPENEIPGENEDVDVTLGVENETEAVSGERNGVFSSVAGPETEENMVLESSNGNIEVTSNIGTDHHLVSGDSVPVNKDYVEDNLVEDNLNMAIPTDDREINQPPISANPSLVRRTSWGGCCGIFQVLGRSKD